MAWVKIDDQFSDHPKVLEVGPLAECLFVRGLTYASRYLTDGFVPASHLRRMGDLDAFEEAGKLVDAGLWYEAEGGFQIHDYLEYQPSSEKVKADREAARLRMEAARAGKHSGNNPSRSPEVRPNTSRSSHNPVPSRPGPQEEVPSGTSGGGAKAPTTPQPAEPDKPDPPKKRAHRIPTDFAISDRDREWAREKGASPLLIEQQTEKFVNYWTAESGAKASKLDWHAAWKVWMARDFPDDRKPGGLTIHEGGKQLTEEERSRIAWRKRKGIIPADENNNDNDFIDVKGIAL